MPKNKYLSRSFYLFGLFVLFLFASCAVTSFHMQVLTPGRIKIPDDIRTVAVLNRSLPAKKQRVWNILEGFVSGESILADREGSQNCITGLANQLNAADRLHAVMLNTLDYRGTGTRQFPPLLSWDEVEKICKQYNTDALICLEVFDSNIGLKKDQKMVKKTVNDKEIMVPEFLANLVINVSAGWRIYDVHQRRIIDENTYTHEKYWNSKGETLERAMTGLPSKRDAINQAGYFSGQQYGRYISPFWRSTSRMYYVKGHDDLKKAKRYVLSDDWKGAATIWNPLTHSSNIKVAGRACYNMAVANEMEGDLDVAMEWATKAYKQYGLKKALTYMHTLQRRMAEVQKLSEQ